MVKIDKTTEPVPLLLSSESSSNKSTLLTEQLCADYGAGNRKFTFKKTCMGVNLSRKHLSGYNMISVVFANLWLQALTH